MDPSNSASQVELGYAEYMQLMEMALQLMQEADIHIDLHCSEFIALVSEQTMDSIKLIIVDLQSLLLLVE